MHGWKGGDIVARRKGSPIEEASRKGITDGRYKNPWEGAKAKEKKLFKKLRDGTLPK